MHPGLQLVVAMWAMTALSLTLMLMRLYTRVRIVCFVGIEDHLYALTGVFLLAFTACIQVSVHYGLGSSFWTLSLDRSSDAIFWTYIANTMVITGNCLSKLSMAFFLLRVVQLRGQKIALWILVGITAATSFALAVMLWNQTTPRKASWDPLRTPGQWNIQIQPMSVGLGAWSSACDFFLAIFPWMFIWSLHMPRREKIMLASGMSLGVIAGACGIVRTVVLSQLEIDDYTLNFAKYFVWAGAEVCVSMICLGIPTLRPLYLRRRGTTAASASGATGGRGSRANRDVEAGRELPRFTMMSDKKEPLGEDKGQDTTDQATQKESDQKATAPQNNNPFSNTRSPTNETRKQIRDSTCSHTTLIEDETNFNSPPTSSYSYSSDRPLLFSPTLPIRPATAHTRSSTDQPQRRLRSDSLEDFIGLYDEGRGQSRAALRLGSLQQQQQQQQQQQPQTRAVEWPSPSINNTRTQAHSPPPVSLRTQRERAGWTTAGVSGIGITSTPRPGTAPEARGDRGGQIWVKNEVWVGVENRTRSRSRGGSINWPLRS